MTLGDARAQATLLGGTLASVRSQANNDWLAARLSVQYVWIGLSDEAVEGSFVWDDATPLAYTNWAPGEPDDDAGTGGGGDGVAFDRDASGGAKWLDTNPNFVGFVQGAVVTTPVPLPKATEDSYAMLAEDTLTAPPPGVLENDTPNDGEAVLVTPPAHAASFSLAADGSFDYTPVIGYSGADTFSYKVVNATGSSATVGCTILVYYPLSTLTANVTNLVGGYGTTGRVTLAGPASAGGSVVDLASNSPKLWSPASAKVLWGKSFRTFGIGTGTVTSTTIVTLTASFRGVVRTLDLTLNPGGLISLGIAPTSFLGGESATGTVRISGPAPVGGRKVFLFSSTPDVTVPAEVIVPAGLQSRSFTVSSSPVSVTTLVSVVAKAGSVQRTVVVTLNP